MLINVIDAKNKIHENLNQNLEKYFKIDKKNKIYIVKIKEINSLFDSIISYQEALVQFIKLYLNQPKNIDGNRTKTKGYEASPHADPFNDKIDLEDKSEELIFNFPGIRKKKLRYTLTHATYVMNDLEEHIANLIAFKNDYLNKESKKYIDSDMIFDKKLLKALEMNRIRKAA